MTEIREICFDNRLQERLMEIRDKNDCSLINVCHSPYMKGMVFITPLEWELLIEDKEDEKERNEN